MADRVLGTFPESLSRKAFRSLENLGVTPLLEHRVVDIDAEAVTVQAHDGGTEHIPASTVIWAAGVTASSLAKQLGDQTDAEVDRAGRVIVEPDLTLPGHPEVFAIGDMVQVRGPDGKCSPSGPRAGGHAGGPLRGEGVRDRLRGRDALPFHYRDKATWRRSGAPRPSPTCTWLRLSGFPAWVTWLGSTSCT